MVFHHHQRELNRIGALLHVAAALTTFALVAIIMLIAILPVDGQRIDHEAEIARLDRLLATAPRVEASHRRLKQQLKEVRRRNAELRKRITDGAREGEFLGQVTQAAKEVDLQLLDFRPGEVAQHGRYGTMRVELQCKGAYQSICRFLQRLEALPRLATAPRIENPAPLHSPSYSLVIALDIYFADDHPIADRSQGGEVRDA